MPRYVDQFLSFRCAGDVIGVVGIMKNATKEISEAMAIVRRIKPIVIKDPSRWTLVDLCSGNALVPVTTAFTLPTKHNYAIDKRERTGRRWSTIKRFTYTVSDAYSPDTIKLIKDLKSDVILTSVHPCKGLADRVVEIYNQCENARHLFLMPCCVGKVPFNVSARIEAQSNRDNLWGLHLALAANGRLTQDTYVLSPKNRLVIASKDGHQDTRTEESLEEWILSKTEEQHQGKSIPAE